MNLPIGPLRMVSHSDGVVISDSRTDKIATLNVSGGMVWGMLQRGDATDQIIAHVVETTGAAEELVRADIRRFMSELRDHGLIEVGRGPND